MPIRSKKYFRKIKIIKHKKEGKEIEVVKLEPKCSVSKKPRNIAVEELLDQPTTSVVQEGNFIKCNIVKYIIAVILI
jgi:hypothetical protein